MKMDLTRSVLRAILPAGDAPGVSEVRDRLECDVSCDHGHVPGARWGVRTDIDGRPYHIAMVPSSGRRLDAHMGAQQLDASVFDDAERSDFTLLVETELGDAPLMDFHEQLRLIAKLAPRAVVVVDDNACAVRSPEWIAEVGSSDTPPNPRYLYTVHYVFDDNGVWAHTHGLRRCGSIELEMLDLPKGCAETLDPLVCAVAAMWIEQGPPEPGELFEAGKDLCLSWMPWDEAIAKKAPRGPGGKDDRDEIHSVPAGVLMVPKETWTGRKLCCPSSLVSTLERNPMLYVSNMETARMALLAAEKLPRFARLFAELGQDEGWRFLVKLGYPVDGAADADEREHLWFDVHAIEGDRVDATLLNQPYYIERMYEGQRDSHELEKLSDWAILGPHGRFGPDSVHALDRFLDH